MDVIKDLKQNDLFVMEIIPSKMNGNTQTIYYLCKFDRMVGTTKIYYFYNEKPTLHSITVDTTFTNYDGSEVIIHKNEGNNFVFSDPPVVETKVSSNKQILFTNNITPNPRYQIPLPRLPRTGGKSKRRKNKKSGKKSRRKNRK